MTDSVGTGRWFQPVDIDPQAPLRLFLFPHAGSGGLIYRGWNSLLPADIAHQIVQIPGREMRRAEPAFLEIEPLVEALYDALVDELDDRPYAFFGHCLGAQLAYRVALLVERDGGPAPVLIGASGWTPVGFSMTTMEQAHMPEPELIVWMKNLGSFPEETYDDPEMLAMIIPALRADLEVSATYVDDGAAISVPIVAYSGKSDPLMKPEAMRAWAGRTPTYLGNSTFPGGHFYIDHREHAMVVTSDYVRHVRRLLAVPPTDGAGPNGSVPNGSGPNGAGPNGAGPNGAGPNVLLQGGPADLSETERLRRVDDVDSPQQQIKLQRGNRYEHFVPTPDVVEAGQRRLHVYRWAGCTYLAE